MEALERRLDWSEREFPWGPGELALVKTAPPFVDSICETLGPLRAGAALLVLNPRRPADLPALCVAVSS